MGGKRTSGRSNSGGMYPRISSGDSKPLEYIQKESRNRGDGERYSPHKSNFNIISILEHQESESREDEPGERERRGKTEALPSFWPFVQPEASNNRHNTDYYHQRTLPLYKKENLPNQFENAIINDASGAQNKKMVKKRKSKKKIQSAKVQGFKMEENLKRDGPEWLRVLTPPAGANSSRHDNDEDDDENDELIKRYFSGLSSAGSSISWAEDAMESEFTSQLSNLWEDIENVCGGGTRPEKMSDAVYDECLEWRKAFPNPDLHRFTRNEAEVSPVESPTLDEYREGEGDDAPFSSLVHAPHYKMGRNGLDDGVNSLQTNFRALNCTTPRPNIEKSTEYVSAWLSECQNTSYVPDQTRLPRLDYKNRSRASSPSLSMKNHHPTSASTFESFADDGAGRGRGKHSLRLVSNLARSSYAHFSRSHAKLVTEPNRDNFFTSMALANNENYSGVPPPDNYRYRQNIINEYDEDGDADDDDGGRESPGSPITEIVSFRPNVKVQRPISSRIRDHTITPLATGYSSLAGGRHGVNLNRQIGTSSNNPKPFQLHENPRRMGESSVDPTSPTQSAVPGSSFGSRIRSGLARQGQMGYGISSMRPQAPWSRHTGDDNLATDTNYVASLYENYQSSGGGGNSTDRVGLRSSYRPRELRSPTSSVKNGYLNYNRSTFEGGPGSIPELDGNGQSYKSASWLMSRRISPDS